MRCRASSWVAKCSRNSSSASSVPKNDSHIALSYASPAVPIDGCTPASRQRRPNAMDVYWASLVRVQDDAFMASLQQRHVQCPQHQFGVQMAGHRPANDAATKYVENHGQIQKPLAGRDVRGVRHPQHVHRLGTEVPAHQIGRTPGSSVLSCGMRPAPPARTAQACQTHQACNPLASYMHAFARELRVDTWCPIRAARTRMQGTDARKQLGIATRPSGWLTHQPRVVTARGDPEQPCHRCNGPPGPVRSHESVPPLGGTAPVSLANQAAACERMSLSIFNSRFSRRRRESSCRSVVVSPS